MYFYVFAEKVALTNNIQNLNAWMTVMPLMKLVVVKNRELGTAF